jgi:hypothetical protein
VEVELPRDARQRGQGRSAGVGDRRQYVGRGLARGEARRGIELGDVVSVRSSIGSKRGARDAPSRQPLRGRAADGRGIVPRRTERAGVERALRCVAGDERGSQERGAGDVGRCFRRGGGRRPLSRRASASAQGGRRARAGGRRGDREHGARSTRGTRTSSSKGSPTQEMATNMRRRSIARTACAISS